MTSDDVARKPRCLERWDDRRKHSTNYLVRAEEGWTNAYNDLARRAAESDADEALAVARILRATLRALLRAGAKGDRHNRFLADVSSAAKQYLEETDLTLGPDVNIYWVPPDGLAHYLNWGDIGFEKGTRQRTFMLDAVLGGIEIWKGRGAPDEGRGDPRRGIQALPFALELIGVFRGCGLSLPDPTSDAHEALLVRVRDAMRKAYEAGKPAESILKAALRACGMNHNQIKSLLNYRTMRK